MLPVLALVTASWGCDRAEDPPSDGATTEATGTGPTSDSSSNPWPSSSSADETTTGATSATTTFSDGTSTETTTGCGDSASVEPTSSSDTTDAERTTGTGWDTTGTSSGTDATTTGAETSSTGTTGAETSSTGTSESSGSTGATTFGEPQGNPQCTNMCNPADDECFYAPADCTVLVTQSVIEFIKPCWIGAELGSPQLIENGLPCISERLEDGLPTSVRMSWFLNSPGFPGCESTSRYRLEIDEYGNTQLATSYATLQALYQLDAEALAACGSDASCAGNVLIHENCDGCTEEEQTACLDADLDGALIEVCEFEPFSPFCP